jgi:hypothetical protein
VNGDPWSRWPIDFTVPRAARRLLIVLFLFAAGSWSVLATFTAGSAAAPLVQTSSLGAPSNLTVASGTTTLSWGQSTSTWATGTRIYRATTSGGSYLQIAQIANSTTTTYTDAPGSGSFYYVVRAYYDGNGANWTSPDSNEASVSTISSLSLAPSSAGPGAELSGSLKGLPIDDSIAFHFDSIAGPTLVGTAEGAATPTTVQSDTDSPVTVVLPGNAGNGAHTVYAVGSPSGRWASAAVTVDAAAPPQPSFTSTPPASSNSTTATFAFTDTEPGVTFSCSRDGATPSACTSPRTLVNLSGGTHSFAVTAADAFGNVSSAVTSSFAVDVTAPPSPTLTGTPASTSTSTSASFTFSDAEGGVAFKCSLDGAAATACSSPSSSTVTNGQHTITVAATDAAGNTSPATSYQWLVDTAGFRAFVTSPADGSYVNSAAYTAGCGTASTDDICGTAVNGSGRTMTTVQVSLKRSDNQYWTGSGFGTTTETWLTATGTSSWSLPMSVGSLSQNTYTLHVRASDGGSPAVIAATTFYLDKQTPSTAISTPAVNSNYTATSWASGCGTTTTDDLCGTASDPVIPTSAGGIDHVEVSLRQTSSGKYWDGFGFNAVAETVFVPVGTTTWSLPFDYADFPADGGYSVRAVAFDRASNASGAATTSFTVDRVAPTGAITFPASGSVLGTSGYTAGCGTPGTNDVCGTATDAASGVGSVKVSIQRGTGNYWNGTSFASATEVKLTATGTTSWSYGFGLTNFPTNGNYTVRAYPADAVGNVRLAATSTFNLDKTPPPAPILTSSPANPTSATTAGFSFTDSETTATLSCSLDGATVTSCTSPKNYTGLVQGTHTVAVTATDVHGNTATTNFAWVVDTAPPTAAVSSPSASGVYSASTWTTLCGTSSVGDACGTAADPGGSGVASVAVSLQQSSTGLYWNGTAFAGAGETTGAATGTTNWKWTFNGTDFPATGSYVLRAYSTDNVGFTSPVGSRTFTVDLTPPVGVVTFPANGTTYGPASFNAGCGTPTNGDFCGTASDSGGSTVNNVQGSLQRNSTGLYFDGNSFSRSGEQLFPAGSTTTWSYDFPASWFPADGTYTLRLYTSDAVGNTSTTVSTFTMDQTPPPVSTITSGPPNPTNAGTASFSFSNAEPGVTFTCRLDAGTTTSCTSPVSYTGLVQGTHTFTVNASDAYGNVSTRTSSWVVDTTAPTAAVTSPATSGVYSPGTFTALCGSPGTGDVCGTASDSGGANVASVAVSLQEAASGNYWDGTSFGSATEQLTAATGTTSWNWGFSSANFAAGGNYVLRAYATDNAGNSGGATSRTFTIDMTPPTAVTTFPSGGGSYDSAAWNAGCGTTTTGDFCGTASDSGGSTVSSVQVSVRQGSGNYWNGATFGSASEVLLTASGTSSWSRPLPAAALTAGSYTMRVVTTDAVGNASSTSFSFTSAPTVSYVRLAGSATQCSGSTTTTIAPTGGVPTGRKLIAQIVLRGTVTGTVSIADPRGNTWTTDADVANGSLRTLVLSSSVTAALNSGDALTLTLPSTASVAWGVGEWSGLAASQPAGGYDSRTTALGSSSGPSASVAPTGANDLVVGVLGNSSNLNLTEASGWTTSTKVSEGCSSSGDTRSAYLLGVPASTVAYSPTLSSSVNWALAVVSYQAG